MPSLKAFATGPVMVTDRKTSGCISLNALSGNRYGLVSGVIKDLDIQAVMGVVQLANFGNKPLHYIAVIVDRQLDGDSGQRSPCFRGGFGLVPAVSIIGVNQVVAMQPV